MHIKFVATIYDLERKVAHWMLRSFYTYSPAQYNINMFSALPFQDRFDCWWEPLLFIYLRIISFMRFQRSLAYISCIKSDYRERIYYFSIIEQTLFSISWQLWLIKYGYSLNDYGSPRIVTIIGQWCLLSMINYVIRQ